MHHLDPMVQGGVPGRHHEGEVGRMVGRWCWIEEKDPPDFCRVRKAPPVRRSDWSDVDADDAKLTIATTRILRLTEAGLTLEMIGADIIHR